MKKILFFLLIPFLSLGQNKIIKNLELKVDHPLIQVEASCGICLFEMEGEQCELAVRTNGKTYYVLGTGIDDHGDAHSKKGFCNSIRKAEIQGKLVDKKYLVSYFKLKD
jgi:hypothetical protein